jgi:hypothetical protein
VTLQVKPVRAPLTVIGRFACSLPALVNKVSSDKADSVVDVVSGTSARMPLHSPFANWETGVLNVPVKFSVTEPPSVCGAACAQVVVNTAHVTPRIVFLIVVPPIYFRREPILSTRTMSIAPTSQLGA